MKNKKKILFVNGGQFGYSAGHYYYCKYLRDEFDIHYACYDRGKEKMELEGVNVLYIAFGSGKIKRNYVFLRDVIRLSKIEQPDTLFVVYFGLVFILSIFAFSKQQKILDIRTGSLAANTKRRNLENLIIKMQSYLFDKRIILSESLMEKLRVSRKKTLVLPLGSDVLFNGQHDFTDKLSLIYVGTLDNRRIAETIEGLAHFTQNTGNSGLIERYTIIGFGADSEIKKLQNTIKRFRLENTVVFEGQKNHEELGMYLAQANVGVAFIPIVDYYQCQPATKLFEYGLSGLFTIATDTNENRNFISSENGILCQDDPVSFSNAIERILKMRNTISSYKIRKSLDNYRWESLVDKKLRGFIQD
jgi:glycosyltransferase involved in cell wall biosynthesis